VIDSRQPSGGEGDFPDALAADGAAPRPQLVREHWCDLGGEWQAALVPFDSTAPAPLATTAFSPPPFDRTIIVPFPPESPASGIGHRAPLAGLWYRREITTEHVIEAGFTGGDDRLIVHFGAVDYRADVWVNGQYRGAHEGGQSPFSIDITDAVEDAPLDLVVRALDDPSDLEAPRGKQDWQPEPHAIWYERTTGMWQPVWLEAVPRASVRRVRWSSDIDRDLVELVADIEGAAPGAVLEVRLRLGDEQLASARVAATARTRVLLDVPALRNGVDRDRLLWSPHHPVLISAEVELIAPGSRRDRVGSYLGLRSVAVSRGRFVLNARPFTVRAVLSQGYWPQSHLAAPSVDALRQEVAAMKAAGFTAVRLHQKAEDPRLLFFADRLGLAVWAETASAFSFSERAVERLAREWTELVRRDLSHPSIVTWVPLNESWGVEQITVDERQREYTRALISLTRALDGTRPVVGNDGWEVVDSELIGVHDYRGADAIVADWSAASSAAEALERFGAAGRRLLLTPRDAEDSAIVISEFGGIWWSEDSANSWGYGDRPSSLEEYEERVRSVFRAVQSSSVLAGFCYTQWADTAQETNGLVTADRRPKLPLPTLFGIVRG